MVEEGAGPYRIAEIRQDSAGHYVANTLVDNVTLAREILARDTTPAALAQVNILMAKALQ
jgi:hypothetical protein